jgi:hypothetical protein
MAMLLVIDAGMLAMFRVYCQMDVLLNTQLLHLALTYGMLFLLPLQYVIAVALLAPSAYCSVISLVVGAQDSGIDIGSFACVFAAALLAATTKHILVKLQFDLFQMVEAHKEQKSCDKILQNVDSGRNAVPDFAAAECAKRVEPDSVALARDLEAAVGECKEGGGDCLPANALAWVENHKLPQALSKLKPGQRILCWDSLSQMMTYAPVVNASKAQNPDGVKVTLDDGLLGSVFHMTADHPVVVQPVNGASSQRLMSTQKCVQAHELKAGEHSMMMLKIAWTPISSIEKFSTAPRGIAPDQAIDWISLSVAQPLRHQIFINNGTDSDLPGCAVAVGSSDRSDRHEGPAHTISNTFLHFPTTAAPKLKRSNSEPCLSVHDFQLSETPYAEIKEESILYPTMPQILMTASGSARSKSSGSARSKSSPPGSHLGASTISEASSGVIRAIIKVGAPADDGTDNTARLRDVKRLQDAGLASIGSEHPVERCHFPCAWYFRNMRHPDKPACKAGMLCGYCHNSEHQPHWRSKLRKHRALPCTSKANGSDLTAMMVSL